MKLLMTCLTSVMLAGPALAGAADGDAAAFLEKTGVKGGLSLVLGAKDPALASALAEKGGLYVQVLQPDAKLAAQWGQAVAGSANREDLSVRNAAFDPAHYDSDLFNLIAVEDAAVLGAAKPADLFRILVPNGCVAFRSAPAGFADEAGKLKMESFSAGPFAAVFRKPVPPVEWRPHLVRKWSAEPNDHTCGGFTGITSGGGRLFYREQMEVEGERWKDGRSQLFARDAYNGRTLWTQEEPVGWNPGWVADPRAPNWGLAADNKGRLFAATGDGKLLCLDAATGKQRFVLMERGAGGKIEVHGDKYVIACGKVFSAEDGKVLGALPPLPRGREWPILPNTGYLPNPYVVDGDSMYICDGKTLKIMKLADGQIQQFALEGVPQPEMYGGSIISGRHLLIGTGTRLCSLDKTSGKVLWTWTASWPGAAKDWGGPRCMPDGDKLVIIRGPVGKDNECHLTRLDLTTGKTESEKTIPKVMQGCNFACGAFSGNLGDYWVTAWNWVSKKTLENTPCGMSGGPCGLCQVPANDAALLFVMPSRKNQWITCDASVAAPVEPPKGPGWKSLQKFGQATSAEPTKDGDCPTFRGGSAMGNSVKATLGDKPVKSWEIQLGLGGKTFGMMSGRHIGLTQAVVAYGLAIVSDIEGQRIVAVDAADGKTKWVFHVGSRADYPPTLYNGLCLFAARDGWVYCLDARTGGLVWKNLVPAAERYIGGCEGLASPFIQAFWDGRNVNQHVRVADGLGFIGCDAADSRKQLAFRPETGEGAAAPAAKKAAGRRLTSDLGDLAERFLKGQSLPRQFAENYYPVLDDGRAKGQVLAFDDALSVAFNCGYGERDWKTAVIALAGTKEGSKTPAWSIKSPESEMLVDDIVLTPQRVYCVGHYQRVTKPPEILVLSREDGKVVNSIPVEGFPAFLGMSASGNRLFLATREGKLICYEGK